MSRRLEIHDLRALICEWGLLSCIFSELCVLIGGCSITACQHVLKRGKDQQLWPAKVLLFHVALLPYLLWKAAKLAHAMRYTGDFTMDAYMNSITSQVKMVLYIFQRHREYYMEAVKVNHLSNVHSMTSI